MSDRATLQRLRTFLYRLAALLLVGTVIELLLSKHWDSPTQFVPFVLCAIGMAVLLAAWARPGRQTVRALRLVMLGLMLGSVFGVVQHFKGSYEFAEETRPNSETSRLLLAGVSGAAPLLAPGILAAAAAVAIAATYAVSVEVVDRAAVARAA